MNYVQDNMFLGQLSKRLVIGCVDSDALNRTITKIPFDYRHYKINFVALNVGGRQIPGLWAVNAFRDVNPLLSVVLLS
jgi:hypothetical protein